MPPLTVPLRYRLIRRLIQLYLGLILYGLSMALMRRDPWLSTAAYALLIGPLVQIFLPRLAIAGPKI